MSDKLKYIIILLIIAFVAGFGINLILPAKYSDSASFLVGAVVIIVGYNYLRSNRKK